MEQSDKMIVYDFNNNPKECVVLAILEKDNQKYIIYKDSNNPSIKDNLLASKLIGEKLEELNDEEWEYVENEYKKLIHGIEN